MSEGLRTKISTLRSIAETTEDHARALQADIFMKDPRLKISLLECKDILMELQNLAKSIEGSEEGSTLSSVEITKFNGVVTDLRGRLSSIQACLGGCEARKIREDHTLIKEALQKLFQEQSNAREPSICSFYTAHSLPAVEREEWHEIEKGLREHGLTPQVIQQHLEFIVETLREGIIDSVPTDQGDQNKTQPRSIPSEPLHDQTVSPVEHARSNALNPSIINTLGMGKFRSLGRIERRWSFEPKFYQGVWEVSDKNETYDVIIGWDTMVELKLLMHGDTVSHNNEAEQHSYGQLGFIIWDFVLRIWYAVDLFC